MAMASTVHQSLTTGLILIIKFQFAAHALTENNFIRQVRIITKPATTKLNLYGTTLIWARRTILITMRTRLSMLEPIFLEIALVALNILFGG